MAGSLPRSAQLPPLTGPRRGRQTATATAQHIALLYNTLIAWPRGTRIRSLTHGTLPLRTISVRHTSAVECGEKAAAGACPVLRSHAPANATTYSDGPQLPMHPHRSENRRADRAASRQAAKPPKPPKPPKPLACAGQAASDGVVALAAPGTGRRRPPLPLPLPPSPCPHPAIRTWAVTQPLVRHPSHWHATSVIERTPQPSSAWPGRRAVTAPGTPTEGISHRKNTFWTNTRHATAAAQKSTQEIP